MEYQKKFDNIYKTNYWGNAESASGDGSSFLATVTLREELPKLLRAYNIASILDIPCGDFHWMQHVELGVDYIGADIVAAIINRNKRKYNKCFMQLDLITDALPKVDLIFCRDCLVHFSLQDISKTIRNIKNSGASWLLTTTFPEKSNDRDITTGDWVARNMQAAPFFFGSPTAIIFENFEGNGEAHSDKAMGLWSIASLPEMK